MAAASIVGVQRLHRQDRHRQAPGTTTAGAISPEGLALLQHAMLLRSLYSYFSIGHRVGFVALVGIPLNGPMLLRSFYSHFSIGGRVGFVTLLGIPLNGPMLLRSLYSDFSVGCVDSQETCAATVNSWHCVFVVPGVVPGA